MTQATKAGWRSGDEWAQPELHPCKAPRGHAVRSSKTITQALLLYKLEIYERKLDEIITARAIYVIPISSLGPGNIKLVKPVPVVMRQEDEDFEASFIDANINASGKTELEAFEMLRDMIVSTYRLYTARHDELGDEPLRQLAILKEFIQEA